MGHRALIAYERPDGTYNLQHSHWGSLRLRLTYEITRATPFGGETPDEHLQSIHTHLLQVDTDGAIDDVLDGLDVPHHAVDIEPWDIQCTLDTILTEYLDYLHHEALYVVDLDFQVTAYRTHWFGLQYDCMTVTDGPTVGNGAIRTVRWYDDRPVGDNFAQGEFRALKDVTGDMIDRGVFTEGEAIEYLAEKLAEWVDDEQELIIRTNSRDS